MLGKYTLIILALIVMVSVPACSKDETAEPITDTPISTAEEMIDMLQVDNEFCAGTFRVDTGLYWRLGTSGDLVIWKDTENLRAYNIASDTQFDLTDKLGDGPPPVAIDGSYIIWEEDQEGPNALYGYDTIEGTHFPVATGSNCALPFVRGNIAVWSCCETGMGCDIYGLNLQTKEEFPVCVREGNQLPIGISSDAVIYWDETEDAWDLYAWDSKSGNEFLILTREDRLPPKSIVVGSNIVAWVEKHELIRQYNMERSVTSDPSNLFGFDLDTREQFEICTMPGPQALIGIAGDIVIWEDYRYVTEKEVPLVEPRRPFDLMLAGIYGYDFSKGEEFVITTGNVISNTTSVGKDMVIWKDIRDSSPNDISSEIYVYDLTNNLQYSIGRTNIFNWGPTWGDQTVVGDNTIAWVGLDDNGPIDIKTDCWTVCGATLSHKQTNISELLTNTPSVRLQQKWDK